MQGTWRAPCRQQGISSGNTPTRPYLSAYGAKTEKDREEFLDLARTWTQAALVERRALVERDTKIAA
jgi:hypothetical protein